MKTIAFIVMLLAAGILLAFANPQTVDLYFAEDDSLLLVAERGLVAGENIPLETLNALLGGPRQRGLVSLIPPGVSVNSLEVSDGVCRVDFCAGFNNVNYGSGPEAAMLGMIVNTLTRLEGIDTVYITVEGKVPGCFGHIGSTGPFSWDGSLVKDFGGRGDPEE